MKFRKLLLTTALAATAAMALNFTPTASAQRIVVRTYPYYYSGYYPGFYYGPRWYYPGQVYVARPNAGEVKIDTHMKNGSIYVDGGYAGLTTKLKHFSLTPGAHNVEVRDAVGNVIYNQRVQVLLGQTTEIRLAY
jgi:hypothetical protein